MVTKFASEIEHILFFTLYHKICVIKQKLHRKGFKNKILKPLQLCNVYGFTTVLFPVEQKSGPIDFITDAVMLDYITDNEQRSFTMNSTAPTYSSMKNFQKVFETHGIYQRTVKCSQDFPSVRKVLEEVFKCF